MDYIECLFIKENLKGKEQSPMLDVPYLGLSNAKEYVAAQMQRGIHHFLLFGVPTVKTIEAGANPQSELAQLLRYLKDRYDQEITLISDIGLSPYQENGHSVVFTENEIDLALSYDAVGRLAANFALAGADYVAPCLSLPNQVLQVRQALQMENLEAKVMPYSAKFSSALYGPYRKAVGSALGQSRKTYQTDFQDGGYALNQVSRDIEQGASVVMVKPGSYYLDILHRIREEVSVPIAVFQVSGEYMMIKRTAECDDMNEADLFDEIHSAFARCGASFVIGYAADHFLRWNR